MNDQRLLPPAGTAPARMHLSRRALACAAGIAVVALLGAIGIVGCQQTGGRSVMPIAAAAAARYRVQVRPLGLVVASSYGVDRLDDPFEAALNVGP